VKQRIPVMAGLDPRLSGSLSWCLRIFYFYILGVIARESESFAKVTFSLELSFLG